MKIKRYLQVCEKYHVGNRDSKKRQPLYNKNCGMCATGFY